MRAAVLKSRIMSCRPLLSGLGTSARLLFKVSLPPQRSTSTTSTATLDSGYAQYWKPSESRNARFAPEQFARPVQSSIAILEPGGLEPEPSRLEANASRHITELEDSFYTILRNGQPDQVLNAMLDPRYAEMVASMAQSTFVEALHLLSPGYFVDPYRVIHRPLHPTAVRLKSLKSLESIFDEFADNLATVIRIRQAAGHVLGLAEYTHLLDCARAIGDAYMADMIWRKMEQDGVYPDVHCYNHYMEAKVWDMAYTGKEKYNLRVTPFAYRKRRFFQPNSGWQGYGTADRSVRKEVLRIFNQMTEEGNQGDEASFVNLILACSRVGHMQGIKNVLMAAWNVDIDALLVEPDDSKLEPVTTYAASSPLHPTDNLLFALAHTLGTNSNMSAALRTVDFIAKSYNLVISEKVWLELFERSFVLSRPRFGSDAHRNAKGKVSYDFLNFMYQTMTSAPYHVRPTIEVHHILAKTAWDRDRFSDFRHHMQAAYKLLVQIRHRRKKARSIVGSYVLAIQSSPQHTNHILASKTLADAIHTYALLRLHTAQQTMILERLARLLIINNRWTGRDNPSWERRLLPRAIEEWQDFLPESFVYHTRGRGRARRGGAGAGAGGKGREGGRGGGGGGGGLVQFHGPTKWESPYLNIHDCIPIRRRTVDNFHESPEEAREVDDDFFWEEFRQTHPSVDFSAPPLNRLFGFRVEYITEEDSVGASDVADAGETLYGGA